MRYTLTILVACVATLALAGGGHNTEQTAATGARRRGRRGRQQGRTGEVAQNYFAHGGNSRASAWYICIMPTGRVDEILDRREELFEDCKVRHLVISVVILVAAIAMATTGVRLF